MRKLQYDLRRLWRTIQCMCIQIVQGVKKEMRMHLRLKQFQFSSYFFMLHLKYLLLLTIPVLQQFSGDCYSQNSRLAQDRSSEAPGSLIPAEYFKIDEGRKQHT